MRAYVEPRDHAPSCFISYAWGDPDHERWVERTLVGDLEAAGVDVIFDRRSNTFGDDVARFISRIPRAGFVLVVGTPDYLEAYENKGTEMGRVLAAEADLYQLRLLSTEAAKRTVIPALREGEREAAFPPLLQGKMPADLRSDHGLLPHLLRPGAAVVGDRAPGPGGRGPPRGAGQARRLSAHASALGGRAYGGLSVPEPAPTPTIALVAAPL